MRVETIDPTPKGFSAGTMLLGFAFAISAAMLILVIPALQIAKASSDATGALVVAFSPNRSESSAMSAIHRAGGLPIKTTEWGNFWVVQAPTPGLVDAIYEDGAWLVLQNLPGSISLAGCTGVMLRNQ